MRRSLVAGMLLAAALVVALVASGPGSAKQTGASRVVAKPKVGKAVAFDTTPPLAEMKPHKPTATREPPNVGERGGGPSSDKPHKQDGALQTAATTAAMPAPILTFEGPSNEDNFRIFGFRVNPPDPNGDVGMQQYVAMTNLTFAVYSKTGTLLFGPADTGTLWQGFAVDDCTDPSGDPIVLFDEISNRWILTQFTTRGPEFFNCVAVSQTQDALGPYFRYAFSSGLNFPDYPKYGVMPNGLFITTREFDPADNEIIGVYGINRHKLVVGDPSAEIVSFKITGPAYLRGDGILPADMDGKRHPPPGSPEYFVGSMETERPTGPRSTG